MLTVTGKAERCVNQIWATGCLIPIQQTKCVYVCGGDEVGNLHNTNAFIFTSLASTPSSNPSPGVVLQCWRFLGRINTYYVIHNQVLQSKNTFYLKCSQQFFRSLPHSSSSSAWRFDKIIIGLVITAYDFL